MVWGPVTLRPFVVVAYPIRCGPLALPGMQQLLGNSLQLLTVGGIDARFIRSTSNC